MRFSTLFTRSVFIIVAASVACSGFAQSALPAVKPALPNPLTLDQAIRIGLDNQSAVAISESQLSAVRAQVKKARAAFLPTVGVGYDYSNQLTSVRTGFGSGVTTVEQSVSQIASEWTIYDSGRRQESLASAKASAGAAEQNLAQSRQDVIANIASAYFELLRARELVKVSQSGVERAQTTLEATQAAAETGTVPRKDILQAQADYENSLASLLAAQSDATLAASTLKVRMGVFGAGEIQTPENPVSAPAEETNATTLAGFIDQAFENRADLRREELNIEVNRRSKRIAQINAGLSFSSSISEGYRFSPDAGENRTFLFTVSYPLFDAGERRADVRIAEEGVKQAQLQLDLTRQNVQYEVEQSYSAREIARRRITATVSALNAARASYEAARESYQEGAGTILDVITAQSELVTSETNAVQAIYDFYNADALLKRAIGQNDPYSDEQ